MNKIVSNLEAVKRELLNSQAQLVAVSKYYSNEKIMEAYSCGQRFFGESRLQELLQKRIDLPSDIKWHFIGHLQTNKIKNILPLVHLIHSVDSIKLLEEIEKEAKKQELKPKVLLQVFVADEDTKYGFEILELYELFKEHYFNKFSEVQIVGLMAMASHTDDEYKIRTEFSLVRSLFDRLKNEELIDSKFKELSMGMSFDYPIAVECGSTLVRVGSKIFED